MLGDLFVWKSIAVLVMSLQIQRDRHPASLMTSLLGDVWKMKVLFSIFRSTCMCLPVVC
jgi:hypothetical protein